MSVINFCLGFSCCPYHRGVRKGDPQEGSSIPWSRPKISCNPVIPGVIFSIQPRAHAFQSRILPRYCLEILNPEFLLGTLRKARVDRISYEIINSVLYFQYQLPSLVEATGWPALSRTLGPLQATTIHFPMMTRLNARGPSELILITE